MSNRTQIVCLHEGRKGLSIDPVFIRVLLEEIDPSWIRPWTGSNIFRSIPCEGRGTLITKMPGELKDVIQAGGSTTLMVWADLDHDMADGEALKRVMWSEAERQGISREDFDKVVFIFAKDRLENWIEFLNTGATDESQEGPRVKYGKAVADAARVLARQCLSGVPIRDIPSSLEWSCRNWQALKKRMAS